ncbi:MAG: ribose-phosphate diphosphokinase, partial [Syntrophorhabdaceae bacterium]|nr:ribose-phosphate diphosphokinase [Syntrophorhabdaceae bacterium]
MCKFLKVELGNAKVSKFSDGEIQVEIEESVRGMDTFLVQPTCPPVSHNLMEVLVMVDALKRASAARITVVIPYYGYARQDRKVVPRTSISARLVANLITIAGASRVLAMDLHAGQIQGFFDIPVDHLYALPVQLEYLRGINGEIVVVSPDAGGV